VYPSYAQSMANKIAQGAHVVAHHAGARAMLYPNPYAWFILASALDILLTHSIIQQLGGIEVNTIADWFIQTFDWWGAIVLKFATVLFVIGACEIVGHRHARKGRTLAIAAVVMGFFPVAAGLAQISRALIFDHGTLVAPDEFGGEIPRELSNPATDLPPPKPAHRK